MPNRELERLRRWAESAYPAEFCAILVGHRDGPRRAVTQVLSSPNEHPDAARAYSIPASVLLQAQRQSREQGLQVLGFLHSHPDYPAEPSVSDLDQAYWPDCVYGIISVLQGQAREIRCFLLIAHPDGTRTFQEVPIISSGLAPV